MTAPATAPVTITIDGNDVTDRIDYRTMRAELYNLQVGYFECVLDAPPVTPVRNDEIVVTDDTSGDTLFIGNIVEVTERKRDNGITLEYEVRAADLKNRLRRSVLDAVTLSGTDSAILQGLLSNAYPDLTDTFNFVDNVDDILNDLSLDVGNNSVLDALQDFADLAGAGALSFSNSTVAANRNRFHNPKLSFSSDNDKHLRVKPLYTSGLSRISSLTTTTVSTISSPGAVSGNFGRVNYEEYTTGDVTSVYSLGNSAEATDGGANEIRVPAGEDVWVTASCYLRTSVFVSIGTSVNIYTDAGTFNQQDSSISIEPQTSLDPSEGWVRFYSTFRTSDATLYPDNPMRLVFWFEGFTVFGGSTSDTYDISNIQVEYRTGDTDPGAPTTWFDGDSAGASWGGTVNDSDSLTGGSNGLGLNWDPSPLSADFNLDIASGDEFASDIELQLGDADYFNSVVVVGGNEQVSVDWTYESDGEQDHFDLEAPVKSITVYENVGTDATPIWSQLDSGIWGNDDISSKDVLYDANYHWLLFATNPPNLAKSFRVTGTVPRPVRVRVDGSDDGDPVLAETLVDRNIVTTNAAVAAGEAELDKRNAPARVQFSTYEPGLLPGRTINITDSARGLNRDLIIQRVEIEWLGGSGHARYLVECGPEEQTDAATLIARNDARSRDASTDANYTTTVATPLVDTDGTNLIDEDGQRLYEIG